MASGVNAGAGKHMRTHLQGCFQCFGNDFAGPCGQQFLGMRPVAGTCNQWQMWKLGPQAPHDMAGRCGIIHRDEHCPGLSGAEVMQQ
jgi:hypothetical protein